MYTKIAYNFKSYAWIFGSLIRGPVLDLELDIAFLNFKLNLMYITITLAVFMCFSLYISLPFFFFFTLFFYFCNSLFRF